eukprot:jgi/Mesvir1/8349/Mv12608-RA.1
MAFRDLVTGGGCAVPGEASSSSNPMSRLMDSLLGKAGKTQEQLRELPGQVGAPGPGLGASEDFFQHPHPGEHLAPGAMGFPLGRHPLDVQAPLNEFMSGFDSFEREMGAAWGEVEAQRRQQEMVRGQGPQGPAMFDEFESIYRQGESLGGAAAMRPPPLSAPDAAMKGALHSFLLSGQRGGPFQTGAAQLAAELGPSLSGADKCRIRDRASILSRHLFAFEGDQFADAQVAALLQSLGIDARDAAFASAAMEGRHVPSDGFKEFEDIYRQSVGQPVPSQVAGGEWAEQFLEQNGLGSADDWASQFAQEARGAERTRPLSDAELEASRRQTEALVRTMEQTHDPKFQNSQFLKFVSKMSRGELQFKDNGVVDMSGGAQADGWASEFAAGREASGDAWVDEFAGVAPRNAWAEEFAAQNTEGDRWAQDFASQPGVGQVAGKDPEEAWAEEYEKAIQEGTLREDAEEDDWISQFQSGLNLGNGFNQFAGEEEELAAMARGGAFPPVREYHFAQENPYTAAAAAGEDLLAKGQELFRNGLLSEAVLALEAQVQARPAECDGWRLLGVANAENDNDLQAIAAMLRARQADPSNLEVLLSLGVSHTNELEQTEALDYLLSWLKQHPKYASLPQLPAAATTPAAVVEAFEAATATNPSDVDLHSVRGVLYNLLRDFDRAIEAFETAVQLNPQDYSLWNKLGASRANSSRSGEAIGAYRQALQLKPNYVRAWSNMGIGYANQGQYEESARYYVRALTMNPDASSVWSYLRISLNCCGREDLVPAVDNRDLAALQDAFPL